MKIHVSFGIHEILAAIKDRVKKELKLGEISITLVKPGSLPAELELNVEISAPPAEQVGTSADIDAEGLPTQAALDGLARANANATGEAQPRMPAPPVEPEATPQFTDPSGRPERRSPNDMNTDEFIRQGRD